MEPLNVRECSRLSDIGTLQAWEALRAQPPASLFGSQAWLTAAFGAAHPDAVPFVLVVETGGQLVALLPLALHDTETMPTLRFAGAPHNDLTDLLVLPGYEEAAGLTVLDALDALARRGWSLTLEDIDPQGVLAAVDRDRQVLNWEPSEYAPTVDLHGGWRLAPSRRRTKQWDRALRRLRARHAIEFRRVNGTDLLRDLPNFLRLREARRLVTGRPPDLPPTPFLEAAVRGLAPTGRCALMEMLIDGCPVAMDLYQIERPVAMLWLRGLDPQWQQFPCGHVLLRASMEALIAERYDILDFGRGDEDYKFFFGADRRMLLTARR
jgi:CelD/BcsL family acetyltransferase involved in cellulose biosynthesis